MSKKYKKAQVGDPLTLGPPMPAAARKKLQHHPTAGALNIKGYNGLDSYKNDYHGDGYCYQSLAQYRHDIRKTENFNPVQGLLGKRAILHRQNMRKKNGR